MGGPFGLRRGLDCGVARSIGQSTFVRSVCESGTHTLGGKIYIRKDVGALSAALSIARCGGRVNSNTAAMRSTTLGQLRRALKAAMFGIATLSVSALIALVRLEKRLYGGEMFFVLCGQFLAVAPGFVGWWLRAGYY